MVRKYVSGLVGVMALVSVMVLIGPAASPGGSAQGQRATGQAFCSTPVLRDYDRVLSTLPRVRGVPRTKRLPFRPVVGIDYSGGLRSGLVVAGESVGYYLRDRSAGVLRKKLGWLVQVSVLRVNRNGDAVRRQAVRRERVGGLHSVDQAFLVHAPRKMGLYRIDLAVLEREGRRVLGRYSRYVRVVQGIRRARLRLDTNAAQASEVVRARVENLGTLDVSSYGLKVQRFTDGRWIRVFPVPGSSPPSRPSLKGFGAAAGRAGMCLRYRIPDDVQSGRYRVVTRVTFDPHGARGRPLKQLLLARFQVESPA